MTKTIIKGTLWSAIQRFGSLAISFISNMVLARLLCPEDFGAMGMVMVFVGIADTIVDGGLGSKPGITKCEHWHHTKWELFIVVSGHGLIQLCKEGTSEVLNYEVSRDKIQSVIMLPGYTHNIINLSDTDELITVMYCNEIFNPEKPDTFFDKVVKE